MVGWRTYVCGSRIRHKVLGQTWIIVTNIFLINPFCWKKYTYSNLTSTFDLEFITHVSII